MNAATTIPQFKFLYATQLSRAEASCGNCGHAIAQLFYIEHVETHKVMCVGCECVRHLLASEDVYSVELNKRRMTRAAKQWRDQKPAAREGETRTEYINRRIAEMGNAVKAHKAWVAINKPTHLYQQTLRDMEKELGGDPTRYQFYGNFAWDKWVYEQREAIMKWWQDERARRMSEVIAKFEREHQANYFDFNKTSWDVRKV